MVLGYGVKKVCGMGFWEECACRFCAKLKGEEKRLINSTNNWTRSSRGSKYAMCGFCFCRVIFFVAIVGQRG